MSVFLSTPSARRATQGLEQYNRHNQNFYPRPLRGGRPSATAKYTASKNFYPRPLRGGRLLLVFEQAGLFVISIHALCEEGDENLCGKLRHPGNFYPRPLRGGRPGQHGSAVRHNHISIHALCEEGDQGSRPDRQAHAISIHALCEEGDAIPVEEYKELIQFLSTPSARRATPGYTVQLPYRCNFYPRPLRGGRRAAAICSSSSYLFLSTPSARRATRARAQS